jgi:aminoglycoside 6'-N-acetyltransferase I
VAGPLVYGASRGKVEPMQIREAKKEDLEALAQLRVALWPDGSLADHRTELLDILGSWPGVMPLTCFVAEEPPVILGFIEAGLRSYADGCDYRRPCGFVEGWYVLPEREGEGIGRALMARAEAWAREQGCLELASDTWLDNVSSQSAYQALGFEEVDRCVNYRKSLIPPSEVVDDDSDAVTMATLHYGRDLARVHHQYFAMVAEAAARELLKRLAAGGVTGGRIVELASGSGISAKHLVAAGFDVVGYDISAAMISLARQHVPQARFVCQSLWQADLSSCIAVTAIGEAFNYISDTPAGRSEPSLEQLNARIAQIEKLLPAGGILLFDSAGPGRSGPAGKRQVAWDPKDAFLWLSEREDSKSMSLTRQIETFVKTGELYRRCREVHQLRLLDPDRVERLLEQHGFAVDRFEGYGDLILPGWTCFAATKL